METISLDYLNKFNLPSKPAAPRSEREEMLNRFLDRLNPDRTKAGYKPLTAARLATSLKGIPLSDWHAFYQQCEQAREFSRYFWWALKPKA